MDTRTALKNRILTLCAERQITLNKLAEVSGMTPSTLKNILYGKNKNHGVVTIKILCDGLGISLTDFFLSDEFSNLEQEIQ